VDIIFKSGAMKNSSLPESLISYFPAVGITKTNCFPSRLETQ
jgi:hypothetical protein